MKPLVTGMSSHFPQCTLQPQYLFLQLLPVGLLDQEIAHKENKHLNGT
jgi:hypothetical protein